MKLFDIFKRRKPTVIDYDSLKKFIDENYRDSTPKYSRDTSPRYSRELPDERDISKDIIEGKLFVGESDVFDEIPSEKENKEPEPHIQYSDRNIRYSTRDEQYSLGRSLEALLKDSEKSRLLDESFSEKLFRIIDEKKLKDSYVYKKAGIDRKLFSKIRDANYKPSRKTALMLAIALELPIDETKDLIGKAGYALSKAILGDVIIEYFIKNGVFDLYTINEALLKYDQQILN